MGGVNRWFPYDFADCRRYVLLKAAIPSQEQDASVAFGVDNVFPA